MDIEKREAPLARYTHFVTYGANTMSDEHANENVFGVHFFDKVQCQMVFSMDCRQ